MPLPEDELIRFRQELILFPSPSGKGKGVANWVAFKMKELGYDEVVVDDWGNVVGKIQGEQDRAAIIFDGHMDVVPITDASAWHYDLYAAEIPNDKIYGRDASDMKGALSAIICGIGSLVPMLPDLCKVTYDRRLLVNENKREVVETIKSVVGSYDYYIDANSLLGQDGGSPPNQGRRVDPFSK